MQDEPGFGVRHAIDGHAHEEGMAVNPRIRMACRRRGEEMPRFECEFLPNACHSESLRQTDQFVGLQGQAPSRMAEAITRRRLYVGALVRSVHRLKEKMAEVKPLEARRIGALLRKNEFQLVAGLLNERRAGLGAYTNPVDAGRSSQ